jgi:hypothetical protein
MQMYVLLITSKTKGAGQSQLLNDDDAIVQIEVLHNTRQHKMLELSIPANFLLTSFAGKEGCVIVLAL